MIDDRAKVPYFLPLFAMNLIVINMQKLKCKIYSYFLTNYLLNLPFIDKIVFFQSHGE